MKINEMVSVIIPTYRRCDTLVRAIDSVLKQTYQRIEIVVVDDNVPNDENSIKVQNVLEKYKDEHRVRYIQQEKHINGAVARNVGVKNSYGKYIAFLDDDDEWQPTKIEKQLLLLQDHPECGGVSSLYEIRNKGEIVSRNNPYSNENLQFNVLRRKVAIYTSTFLCEKKSFLESGAFNENLLRHQDLQMFVDFLENNKIVVLNEYETIIHADSEINRPNVTKLIEYKARFFEVINLCLMKYDKKEIKRIKNAHYFELVFVALKEKRIGIAMKYLLKVGLSPKSYADLFERYKGNKAISTVKSKNIAK